MNDIVRDQEQMQRDEVRQRKIQNRYHCPLHKQSQPILVDPRFTSSVLSFIPSVRLSLYKDQEISSNACFVFYPLPPHNILDFFIRASIETLSLND